MLRKISLFIVSLIFGFSCGSAAWGNFFDDLKHDASDVSKTVNQVKRDKVLGKRIKDDAKQATKSIKS